LSVGLGVMKLAPAVLWAMTLHEFQAAVRGASGDVAAPSAMTRPEFTALMQHYPDGGNTL